MILSRTAPQDIAMLSRREQQLYVQSAPALSATARPRSFAFCFPFHIDVSQPIGPGYYAISPALVFLRYQQLLTYKIRPIWLHDSFGPIGRSTTVQGGRLLERVLALRQFTQVGIAPSRRPITNVRLTLEVSYWIIVFNAMALLFLSLYYGPQSS